MRNLINKSVMIFCLICFGSAYAEGYVKHIINNKTDYDCFVMIHQKFYFPIDECLGKVERRSTKTCEGPLYLDESEHYYDIVCQKPDLSDSFQFIGSRKFYPDRSQSYEITYNIQASSDLKSTYLNLIFRPI